MRATSISCALLVTIAAAAALVGCDSKWNQSRGPGSAVAASPPAVPRPVGPTPGPGEVARVTDNPLGQEPQALRAGRELFVRFNCSGCHGGRAGGGMGPSLRDPSWIYGNKPSDIFDSIAEGRAKGMPAWGTKLPESQIWQLVAYIQSLGSANEPDAPR